LYEPVIVRGFGDTDGVLTSLPSDEVLAPPAAVRRRRPRHPALGDVVASVWSTRVPTDVGTLRVLPDAAVDLVFAGERLVSAGPDTTACLERLPPGGLVLGFQLRPGMVSAVLGAPASAIRDQRVDVAQLWGAAGRDVAAAMVDVEHPARAADVLERFLARRVADASADRLADALVARLRGGHRAVGDELGLGERQVRRRCTAAFGYGPRTLARVVRFQATLDRLQGHPTEPLAVLAAATGHVDQAHLAHEVAAFSGLTPRALRAALTS
jgi:AraC-like DNA-binding protein